ncbi:MAG: hypothetical protein Q9219_003298 [cf. Caloplaca sp. 3 TL-2023]
MEGIEVFIRKEKAFASASALNRFLTARLAPYGISSFEIRILIPRNLALLITHKRREGEEFLRRFKQFKMWQWPKWQYEGEKLTIRPSTNTPNQVLIWVLQREEKVRLLNGLNTLAVPQAEPPRRDFRISSLACGNWEYMGSEVYFHPYHIAFIDATITFGDRQFVLESCIKPDPNSSELVSYPPPEDDVDQELRYRLIFPYSAMVSVTLDRKQSVDESVLHPIVGIISTMMEAPKMWINKFRGIGLQDLPWQISTSCQVYHLRLDNSTDFSYLFRLERQGLFPQSSISSISALNLGESFLDQIDQLLAALDDPKFGFTYPIKFQLQKLAQNGYLPPRVVGSLLVHVSFMKQKYQPTSTIAAIRRLFQQLPYPGPSTQASELDIGAVITLLQQNVESVDPDPVQDNLIIHRAEVTPTAVYLAGPDPEAGNRVLRKYARFSDFFLRVTFMDENGEGFFFSRERVNAVIYHERFNEILNDGISVGGRLFKFLGFSHSSLRARTCWFLASFEHQGEVFDADTVIAKLGDFSHIRSPARCAARIGQAFTETPSSVSIKPNCVWVMNDVERNKRCFSDGCGTCSPGILATLQDTQQSGVPATVFQVRFQGAKGVLSLDNRLQGDMLCLRPSMIKYKGSEEWQIEICGIASRMLPLVLNRQLIKILEDLGVPNHVFERLQNLAIDELRGTVSSVTNAAALLEKHDVGLATRTTWLLRKLQSLGLSLSEDMFFRDLLDAVVLIQLQDIKYRTRIPVKNGATLYGIMDESGYLEEGEVFCQWIDRNGREDVATGRVVVTRSPALHPGDIQIAQAIDVPQGSPLKALHNCIVFSSKGTRDLPSQLSGGDLDGDHYHIIWDQNLIPPACQPPASYPRDLPLDIGRPVTREDLSNFFIQFMELDQLSRVATQHQILANQYKEGTLHPNYTKLTALHLIAVDFSKTGRAINDTQLPAACFRNSKYRPDFMAPGRKVKVEARGIVFEPEEVDFLDEDDPRRAGEPALYRYYESHKILGILYRSIDERAFFTDLHERSAVMKDDSRATKGVLSDLWNYVTGETSGLEWEMYIEEAVRMRQAYEATVYDLILQYSTHPTEQLEEIEVFIGKSICRTGYRSKRQKEYMTGMKEKYDRGVSWLMSLMRQPEPTRDDDEAQPGFEALRRSMASLWVGIQEAEERKERAGGCRRESFGWIAAAACLQELEVYQEERDVGPLRRRIAGLGGKWHVDESHA